MRKLRAVNKNDGGPFSLSPSPGTPGEGRGEGYSPNEDRANPEPTLTLTLSRNTGRGDKNSSHLIRLLSIILIALVGCATPRKKPPSATGNAIPPTLDRCADKLQEICGVMLQYYVDNRQLPGTLEMLQAEAAKEGEPGDLFICPVSKLPYVYNFNGVLMPGITPPGRVVLYDAAAVHLGHRWGIAITQPMGGHPLICRVVELPTGLIESTTTQPTQN